MTALLETGEVAHVAREPHLFICQGLNVCKAWPWLAELLVVREGRAVEEADPVLKVHVEEEQHAAGLAHKRHAIDATGVRHALHEFAKGRSTNTLFASNTRLLQRYLNAKMSSMRRARNRSIERKKRNSNRCTKC